ncbi:HNH endonuclease [Campylobacter sp. faydin G-105]|uniref:HNH endonuclease signature motif containing protein n=1 Tax=Campylobacter anatolicus TaxID=2829105 RepID=UPI001B9B299A|nr:HNH endonuclease signature motif containing protein [Campylobacter anatolicus]MBR8462398.1 HNH endonuclease [Campylobacter anatolicus]
MEYLKVSEFFKNKDEIPFLLGAFFGRYCFSDDESLIYTLSSYKKSSLIDDESSALYNASKIDYLKRLNIQSEIKNWHKNINPAIKRAEFVFVLKNDLNLTQDQFFARLYTKILLSDFTGNENALVARQKFTRAFFELRGSMDTKLSLLVQDYFYNSIPELKRISLFLDNIGLSINILNINFRNLQTQYVSGENKRNTQLRINLYWYLSRIGLMNAYKAEIVKQQLGLNYADNGDGVFVFNCEPTTTKKNGFSERINFYATRILNTELTEREINNLRQELEFDDDNENDDFKRNSNIVNVMRFQTVDECAACKRKYNISDRSFLLRKFPDRWYTEIHHFVSVGKEKELDVLENLTKLCPTCHRALGRGKASEKYQKELISNILDENKQNFEFASLIFESNDKKVLIQKVYENLK